MMCATVITSAQTIREQASRSTAVASFMFEFYIIVDLG
jgi:hypothetical protein